MAPSRLLISRATPTAWGARWQALRRSVLLTQGARDNARDATLDMQERRAQHRLAALALSAGNGNGVLALQRQG